jgi:carbonic anhydrase
MDKNTALAALKAGNKRFIENSLAPKKNGAEDRQKLTAGQQPYAAVITCSDSRVSPEIIFDCSFNELFVIRNAGNVVTDVELASVEYALEHLHVPLVLVLGHEKCGAVKAACDIVGSGGECEGHFGSIFEEIHPSAEKNRDSADNTVLTEYDNARHSKARVLESHAVKELVDSGSAAVVCARYQIGTGIAEFFE